MTTPAGEGIDPELLKILVCPACHGELEPRTDELRCVGCGRYYPVTDGIPVLLVDEARQD